MGALGTECRFVSLANQGAHVSSLQMNILFSNDMFLDSNFLDLGNSRRSGQRKMPLGNIQDLK